MRFSFALALLIISVALLKAAPLHERTKWRPKAVQDKDNGQQPTGKRLHSIEENRYSHSVIIPGKKQYGKATIINPYQKPANYYYDNVQPDTLTETVIREYPVVEEKSKEIPESDVIIFPTEEEIAPIVDVRIPDREKPIHTVDESKPAENDPIAQKPVVLVEETPSAVPAVLVQEVTQDELPPEKSVAVENEAQVTPLEKEQAVGGPPVVEVLAVQDPREPIVIVQADVAPAAGVALDETAVVFEDSQETTEHVAVSKDTAIVPEEKPIDQVVVIEETPLVPVQEPIGQAAIKTPDITQEPVKEIEDVDVNEETPSLVAIQEPTAQGAVVEAAPSVIVQEPVDQGAVIQETPTVQDPVEQAAVVEETPLVPVQEPVGQVAVPIETLPIPLQEPVNEVAVVEGPPQVSVQEPIGQVVSVEETPLVSVHEPVAVVEELPSVPVEESVDKVATVEDGPLVPVQEPLDQVVAEVPIVQVEEQVDIKESNPALVEETIDEVVVIEDKPLVVPVEETVDEAILVDDKPVVQGPVDQVLLVEDKPLTAVLQESVDAVTMVEEKPLVSVREPIDQAFVVEDSPSLVAVQVPIDQVVLVKEKPLVSAQEPADQVAVIEETSLVPVQEPVGKVVEVEKTPQTTIVLETPIQEPIGQLVVVEELVPVNEGTDEAPAEEIPLVAVHEPIKEIVLVGETPVVPLQEPVNEIVVVNETPIVVAVQEPTDQVVETPLVVAEEPVDKVVAADETPDLVPDQEKIEQIVVIKETPLVSVQEPDGQVAIIEETLLVPVQEPNVIDEPLPVPQGPIDQVVEVDETKLVVNVEPVDEVIVLEEPAQQPIEQVVVIVENQSTLVDEPFVSVEGTPVDPVLEPVDQIIIVEKTSLVPDQAELSDDAPMVAVQEVAAGDEIPLVPAEEPIEQVVTAQEDTSTLMEIPIVAAEGTPLDSVIESGDKTVIVEKTSLVPDQEQQVDEIVVVKETPTAPVQEPIEEIIVLVDKASVAPVGETENVETAQRPVDELAIVEKMTEDGKNQEVAGVIAITDEPIEPANKVVEEIVEEPSAILREAPLLVIEETPDGQVAIAREEPLPIVVVEESLEQKLVDVKEPVDSVETILDSPAKPAVAIVHNLDN